MSLSTYYERAKAAIEDLFGHTSVPQEDTLAALEELRGEIDMRIEAIEADLNRGN